MRTRVQTHVQLLHYQLLDQGRPGGVSSVLLSTPTTPWYGLLFPWIFTIPQGSAENKHFLVDGVSFPIFPNPSHPS